MNRAPHDNALLASCDRTYGRLALLSALTGIGIGCVWFLCVAWRAGVL